MTDTGRQSRRGVVPAAAAAAIGVLYAALNLFWAAGGDWMRSAYGSHLVGTSWGSDTTFRVTSLVLAVVFLLAVGTGLRAVLVDWDAASRPAWRWAAWTAAGLLGLYGAALTAIGLFAQSGAIAIDAADRNVREWHAFLWDPAFLAWGVLLAAALLRAAGAIVASGRRV